MLGWPRIVYDVLLMCLLLESFCVFYFSFVFFFFLAASAAAGGCTLTWSFVFFLMCLSARVTALTLEGLHFSRHNKLSLGSGPLWPIPTQKKGKPRPKRRQLTLTFAWHASRNMFIYARMAIKRSVHQLIP